MQITDEMVEAVRFLREFPPVEASVRQAINVLDNAGVFKAIDEHTDYDSATEAKQLKKTIREAVNLRW